MALYEPRMEQFLQALERVEREDALRTERPSGPALSTRMRDSWSTGRFWFDHAARKSFEVDVIYWATLHDGSADVELPDDMESFVRMKMEQVKAYEAECSAGFS